MGAIRSLALATLAAVAFAGCGGDGGQGPATPSATASATATATRAPSATASAAPSPSATRPPAATATATATRTATASPPATATVSPTASPTATATEALLRLPDLHAEPDAERGGRIVDAEGREVLLRGVNVNALAEYWQYGEFPTVFPFTADDADRMAAIGWNTVRLLLSWSRVEPAPGQYDAAYLEQARAAVRLLASRGLYTILDLHQDAWGPTLAARPDEVCAPPATPAFGWDGAPGWATLDGGAARCAAAGIRELSPAVSAAFAAFFADAADGTGIGVRSRYAAMLGHVARVLGAEPGVAGYDVMNEPNAFSEAQIAALGDLYADAIAAIRVGERDGGSPPRLVFFEPSAVWALLGLGATPDFARDRDVVYAPHLYQGGLDGQPLAPAFAQAREEAKRYGGAPVLSGEWGSDPRRASNPEDPYFLEHQRLQDEWRIGATLWTWRESCGDPHKAGDVRAGNVPYVWGEFEVDCASNAVTGVRQDLVDQLTRAYVRAAPGRLTESTYEPDTGRLTAGGDEAPAGAELLVFFPLGSGGGARILGGGFTDVRSIHAAPNHLLVVGSATGGAWHLTVERAGPVVDGVSNATRAR
ncbi:cellulase family glycosylhydrolase [bacterium]|nr:cellulase family glycosylhydrolase [bacterium]